MSETSETRQFDNDNEIDLRDVIRILWKRKVFILCFILAGAIIAGIYSMLILKPVYETSIDIIIDMPETYSTRYGSYSLPYTTNKQYLNLLTSNDVLLAVISDMQYEKISVEDLRDRITAVESVDKDPNTFTVTVSNSTPEQSLKLVQSLYDNYIYFVNLMIETKAVDYYINNFEIQLETYEDKLNTLEKTLRNNEQLLESTTRIIKVNTDMDMHLSSDNTGDYAIPVETINPNYVSLESDIIKNKQQISSIQDTVTLYTEYLDKLYTAAKQLEEGQVDISDSGIRGIVKRHIYYISPPVESDRKTSPKTTTNIAIGAVLGLMLSVMVVMFIAYWEKGIIDDSVAVKKNIKG